MATPTQNQTQTRAQSAQPQAQAKPAQPTQNKPTQTVAPQPTPTATPTATPVKTNGATQPTETPSAAITFHEAPFSWNTSAIGQNGFVQQFTIRAQTFEEFGKRIALALATFEARGYKPAPVRTFGGKPAPKELVALANAPQCHQHHEQMHPREWQAPDGTQVLFWSCHHRDGKAFCKARVNERPTQDEYARWKELNP